MNLHEWEEDVNECLPHNYTLGSREFLNDSHGDQQMQYYILQNVGSNSSTVLPSTVMFNTDPSQFLDACIEMILDSKDELISQLQGLMMMGNDREQCE